MEESPEESRIENILIIFTALLTFVYKHETHELTERFGENYLDYRKRTPFFMPRIK